MPAYYSPTGNAEIWNSKPQGYLTEEEWFTAHPLPEPEPEPEPEPPTLEEARAAKLAALRQARLAAEYGGFMLNGQKWDSELKDELRLNSTIKIMEQQGLTEFSGWKIGEGVYITLTLELAGQAAMAMALHYAACFTEEAEMAAEINALTSAAAVQAYEIKFNIQGAE